jgi:hypothetical protein
MATTKKKRVAAAPQQDIRIVIAQRGWVFVGNFAQRGTQCFVTDGYVVRRWGTSKGLGELATSGPLPNTVIDATPDVELHELGVLATLKCDAAKWSDRCRPRV